MRLAELAAFRATAIEMGYPSLATGVLIGWEWLQRKAHIFIRLMAQPSKPRLCHQLQDQYRLMGTAVR
jgi:hypothetical protein